MFKLIYSVPEDVAWTICFIVCAATICFVSALITNAKYGQKNTRPNDTRRNLSDYSARSSVELSSVKLQKLKVINDEYRQRFDYTVHNTIQYPAIFKNSKAQFDRMSEYDALRAFCADDKAYLNFIHQYGQAKKNRNLYSEYEAKVSKIQATPSEFLLERLSMTIDHYKRIEAEFVRSNMLNPVFDVRVRVCVQYTTEKRHKAYEKYKIYEYHAVTECKTKLIEEERYRQSEEYRKKKARSEMTPKLRYKILKRDGFRCQICGRTQADGVKLHVDHIKPVSKGGETVVGNLRTLCEDCNSGKSDDWDDGNSQD